MIGLAAGAASAYGSRARAGSGVITTGPEGNGAAAGAFTKRELYKRNALRSIVFLEHKMHDKTDNDLSKLKIVLRNKIEDLRWTINMLEISPVAAGENLENDNSEKGLRAFNNYVEENSDRTVGIDGEAVSPPVFMGSGFWAPDYIRRPDINYNEYKYVDTKLQPSPSKYSCWPFCSSRRKGGRRNTRKSKSKRSQRKSRRN